MLIVVAVIGGTANNSLAAGARELERPFVAADKSGPLASALLGIRVHLAVKLEHAIFVTVAVFRIVIIRKHVACALDGVCAVKGWIRRNVLLRLKFRSWNFFLEARDRIECHDCLVFKLYVTVWYLTPNYCKALLQIFLIKYPHKVNLSSVSYTHLTLPTKA